MGAVAIPADFTSRMRRLIGLKFAPSDLTTHWEALRDLADEDLDAAISRASRECDEFPAPRMLRSFVDEQRGRVVVPEEDWSRAEQVEPFDITFPDGRGIRVTHRWKYYCEDCSDTGRRTWWCGVQPSSRQPWVEIWKCERKIDHGEHEWSDHCPCAATNPDVQRKRLRAQQVTRKGDER